MSKSSEMIPLPTDASIITTYRCNMKCKMCNIWKYPTDISKELTPKDLEKLTNLKFINITGGEPFIRRDLQDIVEVAFTKAPRVVISTSGYHVDEIHAMAERFPNIGIRVSIEGLPTINDHLRGRNGGFDRGMRTLLGLSKIGIKDIGFGITVSNNNSFDMLELYELSKNLKMEFATASYHNSYYFHKDNNFVTNKDEVVDNFYELINRLLTEKHPKSWFRAFFNMGLINYIQGGKRLLPCEAGTVNYFIEPYGEVYPCNGLEDKYWKKSMGSLRDFTSFEELWYSEEAQEVRELVRTCPKNCWMVGTAAPVMKKYLRHPATWVVKNKLRSLRGQKIDKSAMPDQYDVGQSSLQGDLRIPNGALPLRELPTYRNQDVTIRDDNRYMVEVFEKKVISDDIIFLKTQRDDFSFQAGQNVSLGPHLNYSQCKDFTIASGENDDFLEFLIKIKDSGTVTPFLKNVKVGEKIDVIGAYGDFCVQDNVNTDIKHLFIAAGVGLSPFRSMIKSSPALDYHLIHGIRYKSDLKMIEGLDPSKITTCMSREDGGDFSGRLTEYLKNYTFDSITNYYLCGSPAMVNETIDLVKSMGVSDEFIFTETYYAY